jgi:hypothetical protein
MGGGTLNPYASVCIPVGTSEAVSSQNRQLMDRCLVFQHLV